VVTAPGAGAVPVTIPVVPVPMGAPGQILLQYDVVDPGMMGPGGPGMEMVYGYPPGYGPPGYAPAGYGYSQPGAQQQALLRGRNPRDCRVM
jgi:hypothetical protein